MLDEVFKRPAPPSIKRSLKEASQKGSKVLIAVKQPHPPSRGKDIKQVLKLAKKGPFLFMPPSSSKMARKKMTVRKKTGPALGKVPRKQLPTKLLRKTGTPTGGTKAESWSARK